MFVTHDQDEAFVLGDEVAVMRDGVIVQQASPAELYAHPVDPWLARFVGDAELLAGSASGDCASTIIGRVPLEHHVSGAVEVLVRPEEVVLEAGDDGIVEAVEFHGHDAVTVVRLTGDTVLHSRSSGAPRFVVGDRVSVRHSGVASTAFPATPTAGSTHAQV